MRNIALVTIGVLGMALAVPSVAQVNPEGAPSPAPEIRYVSSETVQQTPEDALPQSSELPICEAGQEDNCINSWEANRTGNRPINYWPGRPASEIDGPLPVDEPDN